MLIHLLLAYATFSSASPGGVLAAQPADSQAVLIAAVTAGAKDLYSSGAKRSLAIEAGNRSGTRSPTQAARLAATVGAAVARTQDVVSCLSGPRSCRIAAGVELLSVGVPVFSGDTAFVSVTVSKGSTSARSPVTLRGNEYIVVRRNTTWVVTGIRTESAS